MQVLALQGSLPGAQEHLPSVQNPEQQSDACEQGCRRWEQAADASSRPRVIPPIRPARSPSTTVRLGVSAASVRVNRSNREPSTLPPHVLPILPIIAGHVGNLAYGPAAAKVLSCRSSGNPTGYGSGLGVPSWLGHSYGTI